MLLSWTEGTVNTQLQGERTPGGLGKQPSDQCYWDRGKSGAGDER